MSVRSSGDPQRTLASDMFEHERAALDRFAMMHGTDSAGCEGDRHRSPDRLARRRVRLIYVRHPEEARQEARCNIVGVARMSPIETEAARTASRRAGARRSPSWSAEYPPQIAQTSGLRRRRRLPFAGKWPSDAAHDSRKLPPTADRLRRGLIDDEGVPGVLRLYAAVIGCAWVTRSIYSTAQFTTTSPGGCRFELPHTWRAQDLTAGSGWASRRAPVPHWVGS